MFTLGFDRVQSRIRWVRGTGRPAIVPRSAQHPGCSSESTRNSIPYRYRARWRTIPGTRTGSAPRGGRNSNGADEKPANNSIICKSPDSYAEPNAMPVRIRQNQRSLAVLSRCPANRSSKRKNYAYSENLKASLFPMRGSQSKQNCFRPFTCPSCNSEDTQLAVLSP